jgi:hypothetical protein
MEAPPPPLPPDELRALFPNLPAVRSVQDSDTRWRCRHHLYIAVWFGFSI